MSLMSKSGAACPVPFADVRNRIVSIRGESVILDFDVAELYGVETKRVNEAVRNNPDKFPSGYVIELDSEESKFLRSKISTLETAGLREKGSAATGDGRGKHTKYRFKAFSEKGLYMLATILKSELATVATLSIIETFAKVRGLKRELVELHKTTDRKAQTEKMRHFGEALADIVMPDSDVVETESTLELNFFVGKIKHTVRRIKRAIADKNLK